MKKLHEMYPLIFKKPEPVSKELLSFEDWYKQKLTKQFNEKYSSKWICVFSAFQLLRIQIEYDEYVREFTQNNRDEKFSQLGL